MRKIVCFSCWTAGLPYIVKKYDGIPFYMYVCIHTVYAADTAHYKAMHHGVGLFRNTEMICVAAPTVLNGIFHSIL